MGLEGMTDHPAAFLNRLGELEISYLRETDPVRQSGFGGGHERWRTERALVLDAVSGDGDFLDVGCANGYLLECLVQWGQARDVRLTPYGVDYGAQLIALAKQRLPQYAAHFWVANAWEWTPPRRFRYVYSLHDCVPAALLPEYIRRLLTQYVEQGGTLIIGAYGSGSRQEAARDIAQDLAAAGFRLAGSSSRGALPVARVAWLQAGHTGVSL
ncbi:MAG TPA: class I SAM-dependent methyltransferase [Burkholderiales bacterium]|nr:class I SAM-dependent methyltransferase [Burkholderiales bacterium]